MRELLLLLGLISLGYFAESSIGLALNRSCEMYEDAASASRDRQFRKYLQNAVNSSADFATASVEMQRTAWREGFPDTLESIQDRFLVTPLFNLNDVKVSQTSSKSSRTIR